MISIIIPTYNEQESIATLVTFLRENSLAGKVEIIVCDAGSSDLTLESAAAAGAMAILSPRKGRAVQMNYGASLAKGEILYFVHADTIPPVTFFLDITTAVAGGFGLGRYRTKFNSKKKVLKLNAFFTRFDLFMCYGGDQTLFIRKDLFTDIGGFYEALVIMEDYEIIKRAREKARY
ncbi:MAG: glycosyltransferase family 2 protein, partial [Ferruginibacter sp.]